MKRNRRISRILMAVNYNESDSDGSSVNGISAEKDPFHCLDDISTDPTYVPNINHSPVPVTRESSSSHQTCEYLSCTSEVFAACSKCSSFLCWEHFDDFESFNNCTRHFSKTPELVDSTLYDIHCHNDTMSMDKTLTELNNVESADRTLTNVDQILFSDKVSTDPGRESINSNILPDAPVLTTNEIYQHCEYEGCFKEVSSTCTECHGFLCVIHVDKYIADRSCSMHKTYSTELSNEQQANFGTFGRKRKQSIRKIAKINRNCGLEYINSKKKRVEPRSLKLPCNEKTCRLKCTEKISEDNRRIILKNYWDLGDINRQRDFIKDHTEEIKPKYRYPCENCSATKNQRAFNYAFYFEIQTNRIRVCKKFFKSTLDINDRVIKTVREKVNTEGFLIGDMRGKHTNRFQLTEETKYVHKFIDAIPRVESHYLRAQTTREYIDGGKSLSQLYNDYTMSCIENSKQFVSKSTFSRIFHNNYNISFFTPKKDRCEVCVAYENSSQEEKEKMQNSFDEHLREKELSRAEKNRDKSKINSRYVVACYDLQAVLPAPRGDISVFYYISKLATYNLTVSELVTGTTTCYVWHEGQGQRGVTEIGTCIINYLEKKSQEIDCDDLEIVFDTDNCCGQQKNKMMIALYVYAINKFTIKSITHKFFVKGHTQNEGDAVHSMIEKEIKRALKCGPIYSPQEYVTLIKRAKRNPPYYAVEELSYGDFYDVKGLCEQIGNNFSKTTENETIKISDIKVLHFRKDDPAAFYVKTSYKCMDDSSFKRIEIRKQTRNKTFNLPENLNKAYTKKMEVNEKKKQDILKLIEKRHVPKSYFDFYNSL